MMTSFAHDDLMPTQAELGSRSDTDLFADGQLGMLVTGTWMLDPFARLDFNWDIQVEPAINQHAHHFFANAVGVIATTAYPEEAVRWAEFLTGSGTAARVRGEAGWELPMLDQPTYFNDYLNMTPPANRAAVFAALESPVLPPFSYQAETHDLLNELLPRVTEGELTAQEALDQAKTELDALLAVDAE